MPVLSPCAAPNLFGDIYPRCQPPRLRLIWRDDRIPTVALPCLKLYAFHIFFQVFFLGSSCNTLLDTALWAAEPPSLLDIYTSGSFKFSSLATTTTAASLLFSSNFVSRSTRLHPPFPTTSKTNHQHADFGHRPPHAACLIGFSPCATQLPRLPDVMVGRLHGKVRRQPQQGQLEHHHQVCSTRSSLCEAPTLTHPQFQSQQRGPRLRRLDS